MPRPTGLAETLTICLVLLSTVKWRGTEDPRQGGRVHMAGSVVAWSVAPERLPIRTGTATPTPQPLLSGQAWTDAGQITLDDDWAGVPGIVGCRGDGLTSPSGVNRQTVLADSAATPVDGNASRTNPNAFTTRGVAEFELADPTIALN